MELDPLRQLLFAEHKLTMASSPDLERIKFIRIQVLTDGRFLTTHVDTVEIITQLIQLSNDGAYIDSHLKGTSLGVVKAHQTIRFRNGHSEGGLAVASRGVPHYSGVSSRERPRVVLSVSYE